MFGKRKRWARDEYPENWEEIAQQKKEEADFTCEFCGNAHRDQGQNKKGGTYDVRVAAAHRFPNDTGNPDPDLLCLCQSCHRKYDNQFRGIIEEGKHQAIMHEIILERIGDGKGNGGDDEKVYCGHPECGDYYYPHTHDD
jgi:hypothetical protein